MTSGDPEVKKQLEGYWKMLDEKAEKDPEEYKQFIKGQMTEMKEHEKKEKKVEDEKFTIQSEAYFTFCIKPAKILEGKSTNSAKNNSSLNQDGLPK